MKLSTQVLSLLKTDSNKDFKTMTIVYRDYDGMLEHIIEGIKTLGNPGHSFSIILDPDGDKPIKCGWDGDGSCFIKDIILKTEKEG